MNSRPFSRQELINVLRGWHKAFNTMGRSHERNVQALEEAADLLEYDQYVISNAPRYDDDVRPIDANALEAILISQLDGTTHVERNVGIAMAIEAARNAPTLDYAPVVPGEWIDGRPYTGSRWKVCSVCHKSGVHPAGGDAYCHHCGAKMGGGKDDEMDA